MATINFLYRSKRDKATLNLRLLFNFKNKPYVFGAKTKLEVSKHYWSKQHNAKRIKDIDIRNIQVEVNNEINKISNFILKAFNETTPQAVNKEWLLKQIEHYYNPPKEIILPNDLLGYIDYYIKAQTSEVSKSTIKKYYTTRNKVERFQIYRRETILISDVNESFKQEFENYCLALNYSVNTIGLDIRTIKTICKHAKFNGLKTSYQLEKIKPKYAKVNNIYLNDSDLEAINKTINLPEYLTNAKDWLLISCYTGQRISDFMRFNKSMIRYETNNKGILKPLLEFTQKKTGKNMTIPLSDKVMNILNKRGGQFPRPISDQKYNCYIKEVCKLAKINKEIKNSKLTNLKIKGNTYRKIKGVFQKWELVSSHIGRRSFANNYYGKIPTSFLIYMTGHKTEVMFLNYIGKGNKDLALELTELF